MCEDPLEEESRKGFASWGIKFKVLQIIAFNKMIS